MGNAARTRARARARTGARSRTAAKGTARQKIAAHRAADLRARARRRLLLAAGSIAVVITFTATLVAVKLSQPPAAPSGASVRAAAQVQGQVATIPAATFNAVGAGTATGLQAVTGQPVLTSGGKPEVLYIGGEYCPFCAAERWALAAAVSRFGTLSGVTLIHSSPADIYASTPTMSFAKAGYTSRYLSFDPVEWFGEGTDPSTPFEHVYLQQPTARQQALFARYGNNVIPFVDIGNRYILPQVQYVPSALAGMTWEQVAAAMRDPSSAVAKDIDGAANIITAAICTLTHEQTGGVCTSVGVKAAAATLPNG